jgi:hypothetical protein
MQNKTFKTQNATEEAEFYRMNRATLCEIWENETLSRDRVEEEIACLRRHDCAELADLWETQLNATTAEEIKLVDLCNNDDKIMGEIVELAYYTSLEIM